MLGIFLIISLTAFWLIQLKKYLLLKDSPVEVVKLDSNVRTYNVCRDAVVLNITSYIIILIGYFGCVWPFLFIENPDKATYFVLIAECGLLPLLLILYICYLEVKNIHGYIRFSPEEIEYKRYGAFSVKVSDIRKITVSTAYSYKIHLKEKGKKPLRVNLRAFYKKKEIHSLMKQLRDDTAKASGRDKSLAHKLNLWLGVIFVEYYPAFVIIMISLMLLYTSYCCIDYDFFRTDYTAKFNALGADPNQPENAWTHYVNAAVNYKYPEDDFQNIIKDSLKSDQLDLTEDQKDNLRKWFNENSSSWASLKKAASIDYCNITYERISLLDNTDRDDFSSPFNTGYGQIRYLYSNVDACRLAGIIDLDWLDFFQMLLTSSKHFVNGKTFMDQLIGYGMLEKSIKLLEKQDSYELEDLQKVRALLKEHFPAHLPPLKIEGEILTTCGTYAHMRNLKKIPVQTPLNPMLMVTGSPTGTEAYTRKRYSAVLEQARKGIEVEIEFSIISFPIMRNLFFSILEGGTARVYKVSQKAATNLLAAYVLLDLEEYRLTKGSYPVDVSQLRQVGLTSELPDDPDTDGKIIYRNDGQRAILYAVGENAKDDGGYKDDKGSDQKRDDIIFWQRDN